MYNVNDMVVVCQRVDQPTMARQVSRTSPCLFTVHQTNTKEAQYKYVCKLKKKHVICNRKRRGIFFFYVCKKVGVEKKSSLNVQATHVM